MRFQVLACDYDGTVAGTGWIDDATASALKRCIASGRKLILVTGRELPDLLQVCAHTKLFDIIVAENGAVLYRPTTGLESMLSPPPSADFVAALRRRNVSPCTVGKVIVSTRQPHETTVLQTIRDLGLELQVVFNKGAVMVLPSGINKATGLAAAAKELGISLDTIVAVGDGENDHALLEDCALGVAVANAVPLLKAHADWVTDRESGAGVQQLIDRLIRDDLANLHPKAPASQTVRTEIVPS